jgi:hypothetical protein
MVLMSSRQKKIGERSMILKIGCGNEMPTQTFQYEEDCENVKTYRVNLKRFLREYNHRYSEQTFDNIKSFIDFRISNFENNHKDIEFMERDVIANELLTTLLVVWDTYQAGITECNDLNYFAECLLGGEDIDNDFLANTDIKMVRYNKGETTYDIIKIFQPIYLLNDNGKTIDVIK